MCKALTLLEVGDEFARSSVAAPGHPEYLNGPFDSLFIRLSSIIMKSYFKWKSSAQLMTILRTCSLLSPGRNFHWFFRSVSVFLAKAPRAPGRPRPSLVDRTATTMDEAADD